MTIMKIKKITMMKIKKMTIMKKKDDDDENNGDIFSQERRWERRPGL